MTLKNISLKDLAFIVSDHLTKQGIQAVLTGGSCVSVYTDHRYMSSDLDFVLVSYEKKEKLKKVMEEIGFHLESRHFRHNETPLFIEFLPPPPSVGEEPIGKISELIESGRTLKLLSSTDCVKDRLAAFYHWNDRSSLDQAVLVCGSARVKLAEIERWSRKEGMVDKFMSFKKQLDQNRRSRKKMIKGKQKENNTMC